MLEIISDSSEGPISDRQIHQKTPPEPIFRSGNRCRSTETSRALGRILGTADLGSFCTPPRSLSKQRIRSILDESLNIAQPLTEQQIRRWWAPKWGKTPRNGEERDSSHLRTHAQYEQWRSSPAFRYLPGYGAQSRYRGRGPDQFAPRGFRQLQITE